MRESAFLKQFSAKGNEMRGKCSRKLAILISLSLSGIIAGEAEVRYCFVFRLPGLSKDFSVNISPYGYSPHYPGVVHAVNEQFDHICVI